MDKIKDTFDYHPVPSVYTVFSSRRGTFCTFQLKLSIFKTLRAQILPRKKVPRNNEFLHRNTYLRSTKLHQKQVPRKLYKMISCLLQSDFVKNPFPPPSGFEENLLVRGGNLRRIRWFVIQHAFFKLSPRMPSTTKSSPFFSIKLNNIITLCMYI